MVLSRSTRSAWVTEQDVLVWVYMSCRDLRVELMRTKAIFPTDYLSFFARYSILSVFMWCMETSRDSEWKRGREKKKQPSPTDSSKVLLLFSCYFSFYMLFFFFKEIDWKLQPLESTELIGLPVKSNTFLFFFSYVCVCFPCSTPLGGNWLWQKPTQDQTELRRGEGSTRREGARPEHNLETMWHIFHFVHALEPVLSPNWQTHSRRAFNISRKISVCSHGNHWTVNAGLW